MEETLGERIRRLREAKQLTQKQLGDLVAVDGRTVGNWERGKSVPRNRMGALEEVLGVSLSDDVQMTDEVQTELTKDPVVAAIQASELDLGYQHRVIGLYYELLDRQQRERRGA